MSDQDSTAKRSGLGAVAMGNAAANWISRIATILVSLVLTPFVLKGIGQELYGMVAASAAIFDYLWLLRGGLSGALRRYVTVSHHAGDREKADAYYAAGFWWSAIPRFLVLGLGVALARPVCGFFRLPEHLHDDGALGVIFLVAAAALSDLCRILEVPVYATGKLASISLVQAARPILLLGFVAALFALIGPSLTSYALSGALVQVVLAFAFLWFAYRAGTVRHPLPAPTLGTPEIRRAIFSFGGLAVVSQLAGMLNVATDNVLIGRIYGAEYVTHYSLGVRWASMITGFLWSAVIGITPLLTQMEARDEAQRSEAAVRRASAFITVLAVPMTAIPCVVADLFLKHWVGAEYMGSAAYLIALLAPSSIAVTVSPVWALLVAQGKIGRVAVADLILGLANVGLSLFLALGLGMGLLGFALGNTAASLVKSLVLRPLLGRGLPGAPSVWGLLLNVPRALAGTAPALVLLYLLRPWMDQNLAVVMCSGLAAGLLGLAGSALTTLSRGEMGQAVQIAKSALRPGR